MKIMVESVKEGKRNLRAAKRAAAKKQPKLSAEQQAQQQEQKRQRDQLKQHFSRLPLNIPDLANPTAKAAKQPVRKGQTKSDKVDSTVVHKRPVDQVKKWIRTSRSRKPVPLTWMDDPITEIYEGREGDDVRVTLTPYDDDAKLRRGPRLTIKRPSKESGLLLYCALINGLSSIAGIGRVMYHITAKDVDDAKSQVAEFVVKARLRMIDNALSDLTCQLGRPAEAVLHLALKDLAQKVNLKKYPDQLNTCQAC